MVKILKIRRGKYVQIEKKRKNEGDSSGGYPYKS
jgi:hypothetical protein